MVCTFLLELSINTKGAILQTTLCQSNVAPKSVAPTWGSQPAPHDGATVLWLTQLVALAQEHRQGNELSWYRSSPGREGRSS